MEIFWILFLVLFFATNLLDKAESVKLELKTFDEIFGKGWWDKGEAEDLKTPPTNFGQNVHHQIDRQNTQIGQIEPNSTDQNLLLTESDHSGQIEPNNENIVEDKRKRKIIDKFHAIKEELKQKRQFLWKERAQIEQKIAKHLKVSRKKIFEWKNEFGLSQKKTKNEQKNLIEKFEQKKAELKRAGFKNAYSNQINETVAKELGLSFRTISNWKRKLGQTKPNGYPHSKQKELMKRYYEIKDKPPKISDADIAKMFKIGYATLIRWKKQFKRQQFRPNFVDGHFVEENPAANFQKIGNFNLAGSI